MKRFHVHVSVRDLAESIRFYSKLFGAQPSVQKGDYAKWLLEDPRINFAISKRGHSLGLNHLGFQVDSDEELQSLRTRAAKADIAAVEETGAACCYAKSDKHWIQDPQGIAWETFHTLSGIPVYGEDRPTSGKAEEACCIPIAAQPKDAEKAACCVPSAKAANTGQAACCG